MYDERKIGSRIERTPMNDKFAQIVMIWGEEFDVSGIGFSAWCESIGIKYTQEKRMLEFKSEQEYLFFILKHGT
jgi:hypothetical protein